MDYFSSIWFKAGLVVLALLAIYGIVVYYMRNWIRKQTINLSDEKRSKLFQSISKIMIIYKVLLWMLPFYLLIIISVYFLDRETSYFLINGIAFIYVASLEVFFISKTMMKAISN